MQRVADQGGAELARFRRLVNLTIVATFVLIVIGGVVRVSESGLGCGPAGSGTHGWPLCGGRVVPFIETNAVIEFSHRVAAGVVAILILVLAWRALNEVLVAAHLGLAMLLLALLIAVRRATMEGSPATARPGRGLRPLAVAAVMLLFATIVAGGYMAGTEGEGAEGAPVAGAHLACGKEFPGCAGEALPFGMDEMVDVHLTHRVLMYLATIAVLALVAVARRRGVRSPALPLAVGLLAVQILLGALNVWLGKHGELIVAHLTVGTLLWGTVFYAAMELLPVPAAGRMPQRRPETGSGTSTTIPQATRP